MSYAGMLTLGIPIALLLREFRMLSLINLTGCGAVAGLFWLWLGFTPVTGDISYTIESRGYALLGFFAGGCVGLVFSLILKPSRPDDA
jgi:hypothetical protein